MARAVEAEHEPRLLRRVIALGHGSRDDVHVQPERARLRRDRVRHRDLVGLALAVAFEAQRACSAMHAFALDGREAGARNRPSVLPGQVALGDRVGLEALHERGGACKFGDQGIGSPREFESVVDAVRVGVAEIGRGAVDARL